MENNNKRKQSGLTLLVFSLIIAMTLLISALPQSQAVAQKCKFKHTVQAGDTITYVASLYGINWELIADANQLAAPYTITVDMVLCIPSGTAPSNVTPAAGSTNATPDAKKAGQPSLVISPSLNHVYISVENFPANMEYYIRVFPYSNNVSYRLGHLRTNKQGAFADWFQLPGYIPHSLDMGVCLKNAWTDATSCVRFSDEARAPFEEVLLRPFRCDKEGR